MFKYFRIYGDFLQCSGMKQATGRGEDSWGVLMDDGKPYFVEYTGKIKGLLHEDCSCDLCRAARRDDPDYQAHIRREGARRHQIDLKRTMENAIEFDKGAGGKVFGHGNVNAIKVFQRLREAGIVGSPL